jgi:AcrR family transcriptional regulator
LRSSSAAGAGKFKKRTPNRAGRPSAYELARRKTRILEIASAMFAARGFTDTTILDIANKAGVASRTVKQHFGEKEDLFLKVVLAANGNTFALAPADTSADLRMSLISSAGQIIRIFSAPKSVAQVRLMIAEGARFPEMNSEISSVLLRPLAHDLCEVFRGLAARGLIPDSDHEASAELFLDLFIGSALLMTFFGYGDAASVREIERRIDLFLNGRFRLETPGA